MTKYSKVRFLLLKRYSENRRLSRYKIFYNCMLSPNDNEAVFSNIFASAEFNTEIKNRKGSCT